ncbi:virulence factor [Mycolicibacterium parafortuitum]|uniref:Virulence factor n=1 Tax=Mycolicibacterium parafortuitum TaxID=39692 RepID=A0A7I7U6U5_MYCPF|nr:MCE family protein [Mycolicibacterium parafortuitum]BBY76785.1 virulence factor [Mycolicibacterium parafortuitum]
MNNLVRPLAGLSLITVVALLAGLSVVLFHGDLTRTATVTVLSPRAGLVMNPDAKVKMQGITVGRVGSVEPLPDGRSALHLELNPEQMAMIPENVNVDITSSTVFGAKFVDLVPPPHPASTALFAGQVLTGDHVTVEINTVFERLTNLLDTVDPVELNTTLGQLSRALDGRGHKINQVLADLDAFLTRFGKSIPNFSRDLAAQPTVVTAYADAAPDFIQVLQHSTRISETIVDEQQNLDALLLSTIGFGEIGTAVLAENRQPLTDLLRILAPTTDLLYQYRQNVDCTLKGLVPFTQGLPLPEPGIMVSIGFTWGIERYRYPGDLPKVAASGGSNCEKVGMPVLQPQEISPFLVTDIGGNRWRYGNEGIVLNSDGLKQLLFGPIDGPPRNSSQIGMPG